MRAVPTLAFSAVAAAVCADAPAASDTINQKPAAEPTANVVLMSDVEWEPLNPARGDQSPKAGTLWGSRRGFKPTGFLVEFVDGFSSPPHIHNVSYRGVVISGLIHNDDPDAATMWMPTGSFWTQPKGEVHITAAKGRTNLAYIEIEKGPYLVLPVDKAFDRGERPINVDVSNIVWVPQEGTPASDIAPQAAYLWGTPQDGQLNGTLIKLPAGFTGTIRSHASTFRAVVIQGRPRYQIPGETDFTTLEPGSYFSSQAESVHHVASPAEEACVIYVRTEGTYDVTGTQE